MNVSIGDSLRAFAASDVILKKFGTLAPSDIKDKARRVRFMQYRSFTAENYQKRLYAQYRAPVVILRA